MIKFDFKNRVIAITGAGTGIGRCTALEFLKASGKVALISKTAYPELNKELNNYKTAAKFYRQDVSDEKGLLKTLDKIKKDFGQVDILINNASISSSGFVEEIKSKEWDKVFAVNLKSYFLCTKALLPEMKRRKYGKIINISSVAGRDKSMLLGAAYSTSKAAIIGFTRQVAAETARHGINVNCVAPSQTKTAMLEKVLTPSLEKMIKERNPSGYIASPWQIAQVILFLASDEANYMNGAIVDVNGGLL